MQCWICGAVATRARDLEENIYNYHRLVGRQEKPREFQRCYCDKCFDNYIRTQKEENELYIKLKKKRMFERALDRMEHQRFLFEDYKESIQAVEEFNLENLNKFDSSYEIIAAIVFIHNRIRVKTQYKIGKCAVDFFLPDYNIAVEIDGDRHTKTRDAARDKKLHEVMPDLQIIHIPTDQLDQDATKLIKAINAIMKYRSSHIWSTET